MNKSVSIIGCGWLGLPLAEKLIAEGYTVKGSTTTPSKLPLLETAGITPFLIDLPGTPFATLAGFLDSELLVVNIPPNRRDPDVEKHHSAQMRYLYEAVCKSGIKRVVFVSSTSVYAPLLRSVTEAYTALNTPATASGRALRRIEQLWLHPDKPFTTTILRMAGLVGGNRHPVMYLAGKTNLPNADAPVNLVHLQDCLAVVTLVLNNPPRSAVYNICADEHPTRQQFYTFAAQKLGLEPPQFLPTKSAGFNIIDNSLFKKDYHYQYQYPNPMLFY